ncbi:MAG: hypothetical protein H0V34_14160 [Gammaproteobacteria bacterium]|nr:hypothetical protein [Gammaproteobacteria bacterium]
MRLRSLINPLELFTRGAWELAARYSYLNLEDGALEGDRGEAFSLGLNWYPTEYLKLMFNGTHIEREEVADGTESEALIQTRMQVYF